MVHALEEIHRLLQPNGYLIDIQPILAIPILKVLDGDAVLFSGPYLGYDYEEDMRQAENALKQIVQRGLFVIDRSTEFDVLTYGPSLIELQDFWSEPAEAREAELYAQVEEFMQLTGPGTQIALHERARISRLRPMRS